MALSNQIVENTRRKYYSLPGLNTYGFNQNFTVTISNFTNVYFDKPGSILNYPSVVSIDAEGISILKEGMYSFGGYLDCQTSGTGKDSSPLFVVTLDRHPSEPNGFTDEEIYSWSIRCVSISDNDKAAWIIPINFCMYFNEGDTLKLAILAQGVTTDEDFTVKTTSKLIINKLY